MFAQGKLEEPASCEFIKHLHKTLYANVPKTVFLVTGSDGRKHEMTPGQYFEERYRIARMGAARKIVAMAAAHHRFKYIHPFPDGNGRVSRLMSHAMGLKAGIGAHGLWSISRRLARGLKDRSEYRQMMDHADSPRRNDSDDRGNLSAAAFVEFVTWFVEIARDQVSFMASLFEFERLRERLGEYVRGPLRLPAEAGLLVDEVFLRGSIPRGEAPRITKRPERTARETLSKLLKAGLLTSDTPKGDVYLRFSSDAADFLFPRLFPADAR